MKGEPLALIRRQELADGMAAAMAGQDETRDLALVADDPHPQPVGLQVDGHLATPMVAPEDRQPVAVEGQSFGLARAGIAELEGKPDERDVEAHGLEAWEPALAAASAEGLVLCHRALAKGGKPIPPEAGVLYDRVCRLDPATALRLGA